MAKVGEYYSVSMNEIVGPSRVREIITPRHIAMYLGNKHLQLSYVRLGQLFSNRDHTTVKHAVEKMERKSHEDPQLLREIRALEQELHLG